MTIRPRLNVICGRCGKRREGVRHVCRSNSTRRAIPRLQPVLGGCARCGKQYGGRNGNPLTHVCRPRDGDFRGRRTAQRRQDQARTRAQERQSERDKQRKKIADVRERERQRSRAQIDRLKASYNQKLADARAKAKQPYQDKPKPKPRPRRPPHEYQSCTDNDCQRPVCVAFKEGYREGHKDGYKHGFEQGWAQGYPKGYADGYGAGFPAGRASCPGPHGG
jgi:hypothetical protein